MTTNPAVDPLQQIQQQAAALGAQGLQGVPALTGALTGALQQTVVQAVGPVAHDLGAQAGAGAREGALGKPGADIDWTMVLALSGGLAAVFGVGALAFWVNRPTAPSPQHFYKDPNPTREQKLPFIGALFEDPCLDARAESYDEGYDAGLVGVPRREFPKRSRGVTLEEVFDNDLIAQVCHDFRCNREEAIKKIQLLRHPPEESYW